MLTCKVKEINDLIFLLSKLNSRPKAVKFFLKRKTKELRLHLIQSIDG